MEVWSVALKSDSENYVQCNLSLRFNALHSSPWSTLVKRQSAIILQNGALNFKLTSKFSAIKFNETLRDSGTFLTLKIARTYNFR